MDDLEEAARWIRYFFGKFSRAYLTAMVGEAVGSFGGAVENNAEVEPVLLH